MTQPPPAAVRLALTVAETDVERHLIEAWAAAEDATTGSPMRLVDSSPGVLAATLADLDTTDEALVTPVGVVWLPSEAGTKNETTASTPETPLPRARQALRAGRLSVSARRTQRRLATQDRRFRVVAGEPATLGDLRARHQLESGDLADPDAFARYVRRAAVLTIDQAKRRLLGDQVKVPRLVREQIADSADFRSTVADLAQRLDVPEDTVRHQAESALDELVAVQDPVATQVWSSLMRPLHAAAWRVEVDEAGLEQLRADNKRHALVFLPSHRSYADSLVLAGVLEAHGFPRNHAVGGSNLSFWPIGPLARRAGTVFIRRSFGGDEVYKAMVQEYFSHLLSKRFNLEWYFEGGRSRTGKLRPPRFGLLNFVATAILSGRVDDVRLVPVSITYDRLAEVAGMAAEQSGTAKQKEGLSWLARYVRDQRVGSGAAYIRFGESFLLRERLAPADAPAAEQRTALQKVAFDVAVGINRTTPVTPNALMTLTLLGVRDQAMTVDQVRGVLAPILDYLERRRVPTVGLDALRSREGVLGVLESLRRVNIVSVYADGDEPVYWIATGKHLDAAFYRNNAIHWFVNRAIVELALLHAASGGSGETLAEGWAEAKRLRDQLKFEFFFPDRDTFEAELTAEMELMAADWRERVSTPEEVQQLIGESGFLMAHRVLRSFLDAQLVLLEVLATLPPEARSDDAAVLRGCARTGQQMLLQGRLHGPESLSQELFRTALQLTDNYGLRDRDDATAPERLLATTDYTRRIVAGAAMTEELDAARREEVGRGPR